MKDFRKNENKEMKNMEIYLVGGAVRDKLLGLPIKERDWVVVGETPEKMLALGFVQVGRGFPVFLHPKTHEEYALARTERKTGKGYIEFACVIDPTVTLEDDLRRRDLTINAIAQTLDGRLIDPYGGLQDLKHKILRHVSSAFAEDPVRILRVARFAAKLNGFTVHPSTMKLMRKMLDNGEVDALVPERVWNEFERALQETNPKRFFEVLEDCRVLSKLFPEISQHLSSKLKILTKAVKLTPEPIIRFAALAGDMKIEEIKVLSKRYKIPKIYLQLSLMVSKYLKTFANIAILPAKEIVTLLENADAFRRKERFEQFLLACYANLSDKNILELWRKAYITAKNVNLAPLVKEGYVGEVLRKKIHLLRIDALK